MPCLLLYIRPCQNLFFDYDLLFCSGTFELSCTFVFRPNNLYGWEYFRLRLLCEVQDDVQELTF